MNSSSFTWFIIFSFHWTSSSAWYRITDLSWMRSSLSSAPNSAVVVVWMKTRQLDTNSLTPENDRGWYEGLRMRTSSDNLVNHQWMVIAYLSGMDWLSAGVLLHGISRQQTSAVSGGFIFYFYFFRFPFRILRVANAHRLWCCKSQLFHRMRVIEPYHNSKSWSIFMHSHMMIFIQRRMIWRDWTQPNFLLQSHLVTPTSNTLFKVNNPNFRSQLRCFKGKSCLPLQRKVKVFNSVLSCLYITSNNYVLNTE